LKKTVCLLVVSVFFLCLTCATAFAREVRVRVLAKYDINSAVITAAAGKNDICRLKLSVGEIEADYSKNSGRAKDKGTELKLFNNAYGHYIVEACGVKRMIPGRIEADIIKGEQGMALVSTMDVEDYVPCVLSSELDTVLYKPELAKAHAIVIRTFAVLNNKRHETYDFCDLTHCEVFKGEPAQKDMWYKPVKETKGMILGGSCAKETAYFSACCGGVTENAGEFTSGRPGKCGQSKEDVYKGKQLCGGHRYFKWIKHIYIRDVSGALAGFVNEKNPDVRDMKIASRTVSGRVKRLEFTYLSGGVEKHAIIDAVKYLSVFGKRSGWAQVPSKFFEIKKEGGGFTLYGRGHGHGVGLCLQGASTLAGMGWGYGEILKFYFPDEGIVKTY
jgi:stage II sporulation protein D